jgi:peroxiredoxin
MLFRRIKVGDPLPNCRLASIEQGALNVVSLADVICEKTTLVVGMPGAFTPVCVGKHLPNILANVDRIHRSGIDQVVIIARNDPWVMCEWRTRSAPDARVVFLSDGNLDFGSRCGLVEEHTALFLGRTLKRFTLVVRMGQIEKMAVEESLVDFVCTRTETLLAPEGSPQELAKAG